MDNEKRIIETENGNYEIKNAVQIGKKEFIIAENKDSTEAPYLLCECTWNNIFGVPEYDNGLGSNDFLEVLGDFATRISEQVKLLGAERAENSVSLQVLTKADCSTGISDKNLEGQLIILRPEILSPEYRSAEYQLFQVSHGNGCKANSMGTGVFGKTLFDERQVRYERYDVLGIADVAKLPEWAKQKLQEKEQAKGKPSILAQVEDKKKIVSQHSSPKQPKTNNQEL